MSHPGPVGPRLVKTTLPHGITPIMAVQDVANDPGPTANPAAADSPAPAGDRNGSLAPSEGTAADRLRTEFGPRVAAARRRFLGAVEAMRQAAEVMQEQGRPPSYRLLHTLGECHREFLRLRHDLIERAHALALPLPPTDTLAGIGDLDRFMVLTPGSEPPPGVVIGPIEAQAPPVETADVVEPLAPADSSPAAAAVEAPPEGRPEADAPEVAEAMPPAEEPHETSGSAPETPADVPGPDLSGSAITEAEESAEHPREAVRRSALAVLDTVLRLGSRDGDVFAPLQDCRSAALALRDRVERAPPADLPAEAAELAGGAHPLAGLLTVVSGTGTLTDAEWADLHARLSEAFGRPLAVAAARGRLRVSPPD